MLKLIFLALSFFNLSFGDDYTIASEETSDFGNVVFYDEGIILRCVGNDDVLNKYTLYFEGKRYEIKANFATGIIVDDYFLLFFYQDGGLFTQRYFFDGTVDEALIVYQGEIYKEIFLKKIDDEVYCAFTDCTKLQDGTINYNPYLLYIHYTEDNFYVKEFNYGGKKKEVLVGFDIYDDQLYFLVQKDHITESVFGNGGCDDCYVIAKVNGRNITSLITINQAGTLKYFCVRNNYLYLFLNNKMYLFNLDLSLLNTIEFAQFNHVFVGYNNVIMLFCAERIDLYNGSSLSLIASEQVEEISNYKEFSYSLYCDYQSKHYLFDLIDYSKTLIINQYVYEYDELLNTKLKEVSSLFGDCYFIEKKYLEYYQRNAYGNYNIELKYQTIGQIKFTKSIIEEVPLEVNINNNNIYPNGYRVNFNGTGYLDGNLIISNYAVNSDGKHILVVSGANTQEEIVFYVSNEQIQFTDHYFDGELINLKPDEEFSVSYELNQEIDIVDILCYGAMIKDYKINNKKLTITFNGFDKLGINKVILEKIIYKVDYYTDEIYLNKLLNVNVYEGTIRFNEVVIDEDCACTFEYLDTLKQGRFIEFRFINKVNEFIYNFPIGSELIKISGVTNGQYQMIVSLKYDDMQYNLLSNEIYKMNVIIENDEIIVGNTTLLTDANGYYKLSIALDKSFKNSNLLELKDNNQILFNYIDNQKKLMMTYCVIFFGAFFVIGISIRFIFIHKKRRRNVH